MYCIQFYHGNGAVDWLLGIEFHSRRAASRFARNHIELVGERFEVKRI